MPDYRNMLILTIFIWILLFLYTGLMLAYARGWDLAATNRTPEHFQPKTRVSVIVPARNEEANIAACIQSIFDTDYPRALLEIVVVDDHSTDNTWVLASRFENVKIIRRSEVLAGGALNSYKKKALETGIAYSTGELIVTTDADCIVQSAWLREHAFCFEIKGSVMIAGPVSYQHSGGLLSLFQSLDFLSMQGITAASGQLGLGSMSNGANLAFSRKAFEEVGGYKGIDHLASGDDYLLMNKMQMHFPGKIHYLKSAVAIVETAPQPDWLGFLNQRIRWASKSGKYKDHALTLVLVLVYLFNLSFLVAAALCFFNANYLKVLIGMFLVKTAVELYFLLPVANFYKKQRELQWFALLQPLHIIYIILAGLLGFIGVYQWKGRKVK